MRKINLQHIFLKLKIQKQKLKLKFQAKNYAKMVWLCNIGWY
jgi:hypothetical protein